MGGVVKGVITQENGLFEADIVVLAMGPWTSELSDKLLDGFPQVKSDFAVHSITMRKEGSGVLNEALFCDIAYNGKFESPEIYPRPDGEVYMCGFGTNTKLPERASDLMPIEESCIELKNLSAQVSKSLEGYHIEKKQMCFIPTTPDSYPIIGQVEEVQGLYIA